MTTKFSRGARLLLPVALCLLSSSPVLAEPQPLSLRQAIATALTNNPDLTSFREEKGVLDAAATRAGLLPNPTLEVEGESGALTGSSADNNLSLGVSQEFLLGGKRQMRRAVAERDAAAYRFLVADRERLLKDEVQMAYLDALLAQRKVGLARRSIELNRQLLQVSEDRLAAGDIPELEMYLVKAELTRSEGGVIEVERSYLEYRDRLFTLMALAPGEYPELSGDLEGAALPSRTLPDLTRLALQSRPDLKALEASAGRGDAEVALAGAEAIPNLTAGLALSREASSMEIGGVEGRETSYTIGFRLSMPIPVFDKNQAGQQEARARKASAQIRARSAASAIEREVGSAFAGLAKAEKVLSLYRSSILGQLEENLELTREAYRLGEVGILAVIQEQKKYFEVSEGYLTALHARQAALVKLESAVAADMNGGAQ